MTTLKVKVSSKEKTTKELEDKIDDMRKLHWDKEKEAESARRELERRSFEKYEEAERRPQSCTSYLVIDHIVA